MKSSLKYFLVKQGTIISLVILVLLITYINDRFLTSYNILNIFRQITYIGLIAFGMTFVVITAGIDLSVGSILSLTGMIMGLLLVNGQPEYLAIGTALFIGIILGSINGIAISYLKLQPFIVTLATMTMYRGLTMILSNGIPAMDIIDNAPFLDYLAQGRLFNIIPIPMIILLFVLVILIIILQNTAFGKSVYAIGGNEEAARLSSIPIRKVKIIVYGLSGLMSAISGVLLSSRLSSAQPMAGYGYELDAIAAVVIGGTSLAGGKGRIFGTFLGVLIIGVLNNGLNIIGVSPFYQQFIKGIVILLAVAIDRKK